MGNVVAYKTNGPYASVWIKNMVCYAVCMNSNEPRQRFLVISGDRDQIERELVQLLFTPGPTPQADLSRLITQLEPSSSRVSLRTVGPIFPHPANAPLD